MSGVPDRWAAGAAYEDFMGRWSRRLALRFVDWLGLPRGLHWLDVGCGTGALTQAIVARADPASVVGVDPAAPLLAAARRDAGESRATFVAAGVGALPRRSGGYGGLASLLALNFFPDPEAAVRELREVASPGGTVSACVWDYADGMQFLRRFWDVAVRLDPGCRSLDEGVRFPLCRPERLESLFRGAGLQGVTSDPLEIQTAFAGFGDYWRPLLGGTGPAPSYVASLDDARRERLARELESSLPATVDGAIPLTARAWAVRGAA